MKTKKIDMHKRIARDRAAGLRLRYPQCRACENPTPETLDHCIHCGVMRGRSMYSAPVVDSLKFMRGPFGLRMIYSVDMTGEDVNCDEIMEYRDACLS